MSQSNDGSVRWLPRFLTQGYRGEVGLEQGGTRHVASL